MSCIQEKKTNKPQGYELKKKIEFDYGKDVKSGKYSTTDGCN